MTALCLLCNNAATCSFKNYPEKTYCDDICARTHYRLLIAGNENEQKTVKNSRKKRGRAAALSLQNFNFLALPRDVKLLILSEIPLNRLGNICAVNREIATYCKSLEFKRIYVHKHADEFRDYVKDVITRHLKPLNRWLGELPSSIYSIYLKSNERKFLKTWVYILLEQRIWGRTETEIVDLVKLTIVGMYSDDTDLLIALLQNNPVDSLLKDEKFILTISESLNNELLQFLLKDERVPFDPKKLLAYALQYGYFDTVKVILSSSRMNYELYGTDLFSKVMHTAKQREDQTQAQANSKNKTNMKIMKFMLKDVRFDPSVDDNLLLRKAIQLGRKDVVELLLKDRRVKKTWKG